MIDEQKHALNPYRYSGSARSIWLSGFEAAESIIRPASGDAKDAELPPLPDPTMFFGHSTSFPMYSGDEMREYARAAISKAAGGAE